MKNNTFVLCSWVSDGTVLHNVWVLSWEKQTASGLNLWRLLHSCLVPEIRWQTGEAHENICLSACARIVYIACAYHHMRLSFMRERLKKEYPGSKHSRARQSLEDFSLSLRSHIAPLLTYSGSHKASQTQRESDLYSSFQWMGCQKGGKSISPNSKNSSRYVKIVTLRKL